jgi:hypothetical protein
MGHDFPRKYLFADSDPARLELVKPRDNEVIYLSNIGAVAVEPLIGDVAFELNKQQVISTVRHIMAIEVISDGRPDEGWPHLGAVDVRPNDYL